MKYYNYLIIKIILNVINFINVHLVTDLDTNKIMCAIILITSNNKT